MAKIPNIKKRPYYKGPQSDHFDGTKFFNPWDRRKQTLLSFLRWKLTSRPKPWPKHIHNHNFDEPPDQVHGSKLRVSFVGHSTVLIQTQNLNILTDPIWSERASPMKRLGPKRVADPGIPFQKLPKIDLILISHNHYDHLDINTILRLWKRDKPKIVTPLGNDSIIKIHQPHIAIETLDWHQSIRISEKLTIYLEPIQHWSARHLWDKNCALWGAFILDTPGGKIYFAGDTGYGNGHIFRNTLAKFHAFRLALIPIGAYEPKKFLKYMHMSPEEAVLAHIDLGKPHTMGIHYGTFQLTDEGYEDPVKALASSLQKHHIHENKFQTLKIGEAWFIPQDT